MGCVIKKCGVGKMKYFKYKNSRNPRYALDKITARAKATFISQPAKAE